MKLTTNALCPALGLGYAYLLLCTPAMADDQTNATLAGVSANVSTTSSGTSVDSRYGLFNGLDHRSWYSQGDFPEPFLVDDSGLEINEARLDWSHTQAGPQHSDRVKAEIEHGFGPVTLELEVPFERDASPGNVDEGFDNLDLGVRAPFYQYVSPNGFFDNTLGAAVELGIPVHSVISKNAEVVPKIFDDFKLGDHLTVQSIFGYSTLFGGGADGGLQTFEYGADFGYFIQHEQLPLPYVNQFIPMFEIIGERSMNHDSAGQNSVLGNACFRLNLKAIGRVQPRLGFGFIFPLTSAARTDVHSGIVTSLVFEY